VSPSLLVALALATGAPAPKDAKKDPPSVVGVWAVESAVIGGKREDPPPGTTWTFTADGKSLLSVPGGKDPDPGMFTFDQKKDPAQVDITAGPTRRPLTGIYKVEKDTLTLCLAEDTGDRPTGFESKEGARVLLITLTRAKKKD
jgi:uncharacterized protein (TIGR03067 family)